MFYNGNDMGVDGFALAEARVAPAARSAHGFG
jgi:hypothetical protein